MTVKKVAVLEEFSWQMPIKDKDLSTPPGSPAKGDRYIVAATGSGLWTGHTGDIALCTATTPTWEFVTKTEGMIVWVEDENLYYKYDGSNWGLLNLVKNDGTVNPTNLLSNGDFENWSAGQGTTLTQSVVVRDAVRGLSLASSQDALGQGFKVSSGADIYQFIFKMYKTGATGTITGYIYSDNGSGLPNTPLATFSSIDASTLPEGSGNQVEVTFTGTFTPTINTQYHLVIIWTSAGGTNVAADCNQASSTYTDGAAARRTSGTWAALNAGKDFYFKIYQNIWNAPDGWTLNGGSVAREASIIKLGTYSGAITRAGVNCDLHQDIHATKGIAYWKGKTVSLGCWTYASVTNRIRLAIYDGIGASYSSYHTGDSTWQYLTVTHTVSTSATLVSIYSAALENGDTTVYFDGAICVEGESIFAFSPKSLSGDVAGEVASLVTKTIPVDADVTLIEDSAATPTNQKKKLTWANIKATLKTYFDTLYTLANLGGTTLVAVKADSDIADAISKKHANSHSKSFVLTNPTSSTDGSIWRTPVAITIVAIHVLCVDGTNIVGGLDELDANGLNAIAVDADITGTAGTNANDDGALTNPGIDAGDYVGWHTTSVSGTVTKVVVTFDYTIN